MKSINYIIVIILILLTKPLINEFSISLGILLNNFILLNTFCMSNFLIYKMLFNIKLKILFY